MFTIINKKTACHTNSHCFLDMRTELIFFDSPTNSGKLGTARGAIAIVPIIVPIAYFSARVQNVTTMEKAIGVILLSLVLCSAIGVQLPDSFLSATTYAFLVGLVVSVSYICMTLLQGKYAHSQLWIIPCLCLILCVSAVITRALSVKWNLYGKK